MNNNTSNLVNNDLINFSNFNVEDTMNNETLGSNILDNTNNISNGQTNITQLGGSTSYLNKLLSLFSGEVNIFGFKIKKIYIIAIILLLAGAGYYYYRRRKQTNIKEHVEEKTNYNIANGYNLNSLPTGLPGYVNPYANNNNQNDYKNLNNNSYEKPNNNINNEHLNSQTQVNDKVRYDNMEDNQNNNSDTLNINEYNGQNIDNNMNDENIEKEIENNNFNEQLEKAIN